MLLRSIQSFVIAFVLYTAGVAQSDDGPWPQFLGPQRNGISSETGLIDAWPEGGPKEVWRVKGGMGMSGLAISQGRLLTMIQDGDAQHVVAHKAETGERLWSSPIAPEYRNSMGHGPRATPTIHGDTAFVFTGQGFLAALRLSDGEVIWKHDVVKTLGGKPADYGMACSPLVVGEHVIVTAGAPRATVVAYDAKSGELAWKAGKDTTGYSSPALLKVGGREQIVVYTGNSALGIAPKNGAVLWRYPYVTDFGCNTATPIAVDGKVFLSSGENHGCVLLSLTPDGDEFSVKEEWSSLGPKSVMRNEWQTSILLDGHLYGFDNSGSAGPTTHLTCVHAATGERVWQKLRFGKGNLIAADGKLFISNRDGELVVVRATAKEFQELGRAKVVETTRQAPTLADGLLYLRDGKELVCLDVRKP